MHIQHHHRWEGAHHRGNGYIIVGCLFLWGVLALAIAAVNGGLG